MTSTENTLPSSIAPATLLLPPASLFSARASRLRHLAHGHELAPWLNGLADLCDAQQQALDTLPALTGLPSAGSVWPPLAGQVTALEQALQGLPACDGGPLPPAIHHVVRSFDPCMVCTVH